MIRNLFGGATKCRTIDKLDIFGDGSCKALYRFDGNANDESGNYHGTENTAIEYGGGIYERCASKIGANGNITFPTITGVNPMTMSMSFWIKFSSYNTVNNGAQIQISNGTYVLTIAVGTAWIADIIPMYRSAMGYHTPNTLVARNTNEWMHLCFVYNGVETAFSYYVNGVLVPCTHTASGGVTTVSGFRLGSWINGTYAPNNNIAIDQLRIFNRAITVQEVATLYAECEPTSIVDNINPFEDGSLKALYKFDNDATDATGVYNGTATNVTYAGGKFGNCAVFVGSSYVTSSFPSMANASVSFWVNKSTGTNQGAISWSDGTNLIAVDVGGAGLQVRVGSTWYVTPDIGLNVWKFIVVTILAGIPSIYVDGIKLIVTTSGGTANAGTSGVSIGRVIAGGSYYYLNGKLDQLRIFNKALTPLEVASLYNETTPMEEPMSVQVDPFKDGSGKALYRLEGNALDESGNYNGTPTSVTYGSGRFGRCAVFNGSSSSILVNSLSYSSNSKMTISYWIKKSVATNCEPVGFRDGSTAFGFALNTDTVSRVYWSNASSAWVNINGTKVINDGTWHHVCTVAEPNVLLKLYTDGVLEASTAINGGNATTRTLIIGTGGAGVLNGSIDQLRIFNKALTPLEVTALYNEI